MFIDVASNSLRGDSHPMLIGDRGKEFNGDGIAGSTGDLPGICGLQLLHTSLLKCIEVGCVAL